MVKRMKVDISVLHWVDHGGSENLLTCLYCRSLALAKVFANDLWRKPCMVPLWVCVYLFVSVCVCVFVSRVVIYWP